MAFNKVDAAYKALKQAYRKLQKAGDDVVAARKKWQGEAQKAFGADPAKKFQIQRATAEAEAGYNAADARYREALKEYNKAVADLVKAALEAGLDK